MLDKERKAERLAKVYKKKHIKNVKNGELQFSTKRIKMKEDNVHTMLLQASACKKETPKAST
jgi:hypothetical protein